MTDKQKEVLHYMLGQALESTTSDTTNSDNTDTAEHDNTNNDSTNSDQEGSSMTRNVFEKGSKDDKSPVLSHADVQGIVADATRIGSLKQAVESYALAHGINQIDTLFPEAQALLLPLSFGLVVLSG